MTRTAASLASAPFAPGLTPAPAGAPPRPASIDELLNMDAYTLSALPHRTSSPADRWMEYLSFPLGLAAFGALYLMPTPIGLTGAGQAALACFSLALIWWIGEPLPQYATSMLLMVLLVFTRAWDESKVLGVLGLDVIWLNILAFVLSAILIKTTLARRLALALLVRFGQSANATLFAFLLLQLALAPLIPATAARAAMTLPLILVIAAVYQSSAERRTNFGRNLLLQNLFGINIFSSGFMTGSTANLIAVAFIMNTSGHKVFYTDWMLANLPVAVAAMLIAWWLGPRAVFPVPAAESRPQIAGGLDAVRAQRGSLGPFTSRELKGMAIFGLVVFLWVTDRFHTAWFGFQIDPVMAAMIGVVLTFTPRVGMLTWNDADIPWHLMIFSAGAYAAGLALDQSGAARWLVQGVFDRLSLTGSVGFWSVYIAVIAVNMYAHLIFTSKTIRTVIMIPVVIGVAQQLGYPVVSLALPAAFTIDWVIGLPISGKPNVMLFTTGQYSVLDNLKFGLLMTTVGVVLLTVAGLTWFHVLGITPGW